MTMRPSFLWPVVVLLLALSTWIPYLNSMRSTSPSNIESKIRDWLDHRHFQVVKAPVGQSDFFIYVVTLDNGIHLNVARQKEYPDYLVFKAANDLSEDVKQTVQKMSDEEYGRLLTALRLELARSKVIFRLVPSKDTRRLEEWDIAKRVAITPDFSESTLLDAIDSIGFAEIAAMDAMNLLGLKITNQVGK